MGPAAWRQPWPIGQRGGGAGPAGAVRPHVRGCSNGRSQIALCVWGGVGGLLRFPGSQTDTWAAYVLAKPLLWSAGLAADVAPGPARVLVRVPAVTVVAGSWEGREDAMGRGRDRGGGYRPPAARGGHSPDSGAEARLLGTFSQLRQRRPSDGEGWSALYR